MKVTFIGGAGTVTGSKTLLESNGYRILIDCGQFQGVKALRELNWEPLPILPSTIDCVLLTHGHLDHCGWLPRLVSQGFDGKIYCTSPTKDIAKLILLDSAKIQEEEAQKANEGKYSKHEVAEPLYDVAQAERVFPLFTVVKENEKVALEAEISAVFSNAGHILGASSISLHAEGKTLVFSGDIGREDDVLMFPPKKPIEADYVFLESTYGNRIHPEEDVKSLLEKYISTTISGGGNVVIPSFAVERAQTLMYLLWQLKEEGRLPHVPYIIDTPMGISVLDVFQRNQSWHKLPLKDCIEMSKMFDKITDYQETIEAIYDKRPKVIIAASGMVTGGRVLGYLERYIGLSQTLVILVGYQAEGTRGRQLLEGASDIKMRGKYFPVHAKIVEIEGLSAHGDQEDLVHWLSDLKKAPQKVFIVHGENEPAKALQEQIEARYSYECIIPIIGQTFEI